MRCLHAIAVIGLLAGPAFAQTAPVPRYGEPDKPKTPADIEAERTAERAYRRSLGNVPNASGPTDPWGGVRNDGPAKSTAKAVPAKPAKPRTTAN